MSDWRLVIQSPATGAENMAVDEAILEAAVKREQPPTLRLYGWTPPCLSLGYAQPSADVDLARLRQLGWLLVRRPTGGRAILHVDELTYSITAPADEPLVAGSILESYSRLSQALLETLVRLGLPARSEAAPIPPPGSKPGDPVCFEVPSSYEITVQGKKIIGSAQARRNGGVLQHGALPLFGDINRINWVLHYPDEAKRQAASQRLLQRAATVESILNTRVSWEDAARVFVNAFADVFQLRLTPGALSEPEKTRACQLAAERYAADSWTFRL